MVDVIAPQYVLPDGYDSWALKSVRPDLRTRHGFRWPFPGSETPRLELADHDDHCPLWPGDGLCVAKTWAGMALGGFPARTLLLVAYRSHEARGRRDKLRVPQAAVVDVIDGEELLVRLGRGANLEGAHLSDVNLCDANLKRANLKRANLCDANLKRANLKRANLYGANLYGANLKPGLVGARGL